MRLELFLISLVILPLVGQSQNTVCFDIEANPYPNNPALGGFTKYVNVYGFEIFGELGVTDAQVLHGAAITAELLDNDEDGIIDDAPLLAQLVSSGALMPIFASEGSAMENTFFNNYSGNGVSAVLYAGEVDPTQPGHWGDDASVEEILHTINHVGHTVLHPSIFGLAPNSSNMSDAMDLARGGQFLTIPNPYPASAWYHYDDHSCDYECMAIEYIYWCIVSNMGILDDPSTCSGIANEWEPCSPALFQSTDAAMYGLITDSQYKIPQIAPDGNYCPSVGIEEDKRHPNFLLYPNPVNEILTVSAKFVGAVTLFDCQGKEVVSFKCSGKCPYDMSALPDGIYSMQFLSDNGFAAKTFVKK
jgi:hypothetical protein